MSSVRFDLKIRNASGVVANLHKYDALIRGEIEKEVLDSAEAVKAETQRLCAFDTGFMHDHVTAYISPGVLSYEVGWSADDFSEAGHPFYPPFLEFGTSRMPAQPALFPAYAAERPVFQRRVREAVRRAIARKA